MYVIRRGIWADRTAHIVASREKIERPDGENVGDRVFVLCSAVPFYWWDGYSDTTGPADLLCSECYRLSNPEPCDCGCHLRGMQPVDGCCGCR